MGEILLIKTSLFKRSILFDQFSMSADKNQCGKMNPDGSKRSHSSVQPDITDMNLDDDLNCKIPGKSPEKSDEKVNKLEVMMSTMITQNECLHQEALAKQDVAFRTLTALSTQVQKMENEMVVHRDALGDLKKEEPKAPVRREPKFDF